MVVVVVRRRTAGGKLSLRVWNGVEQDIDGQGGAEWRRGEVAVVSVQRKTLGRVMAGRGGGKEGGRRDGSFNTNT